jgi:hypothetical protein
MSNIRPPLYGVKKDELTLTSQDPASVLYGVTPDSKWIPVKVTDDGSLIIGSTITLDMNDVQIGAVELKNYNTDDRAYISPDHELLVQSRLYDAAGTALTSTLTAGKQGLDVYLTNSLDDEDDSVPAGLSRLTTTNLLYGYDGIDWQRVNSTSGQVHTRLFSSTGIALSSTGSALNVNVVSETPLNGVNQFDEDSVPYNVETTILSYIPASTLLVSQVIAWGDVAGEFFIRVDGTQVGGGRTSEADRTIILPYQTPIEVASGSAITISVVHFKASSEMFKTNLIGDLT